MAAPGERAGRQARQPGAGAGGRAGGAQTGGQAPAQQVPTRSRDRAERPRRLVGRHAPVAQGSQRGRVLQVCTMDTPTASPERVARCTWRQRRCAGEGIRDVRVRQGPGRGGAGRGAAATAHTLVLLRCSLGASPVVGSPTLNSHNQAASTRVDTGPGKTWHTPAMHLLQRGAPRHSAPTALPAVGHGTQARRHE